MRSIWKALALVGCLSLVVAVAGASGARPKAKAKASATKFTVGLVTDIGGLNDRSFNHLANLGLQTAEKKLGVEGRVLTSKSNADYVPNLTTLAQTKYDLIVPVGFLMTDATTAVAKQVPDAKFSIIDVDATSMKGKPKNVEGLLFKEQEAGYLVGYLAGLYAKDKGIKAVSSVGGLKIPPVDHYIAGYEAGAKKANPGITVIHNYSQDFVAQDKCKELALNQIAKGSGVVFQVAGQCGLGALDAAKEKGKQGIGVDADQGYLGKHILTSALKKVDVAVYNAIKAAKANKFGGGKNVVNTVANGGVGYGKLGPAATKYSSQLKALEKKIKAGSIKIPSTVK